MIRRILIALVLIPLLLIGIALSGAVDLGAGKTLLTRVASNFLERELRIDGDLELRLGREPHIVASDIFLANPEWAPGELLRVERLELALDPVSLWRGPFRIEHLLITGATVDLVELEDGRNNWSFGELTDDQEDDDPAGARLSVVIVDGQIRDSQLRWMQPALASPAELQLDQLKTYLDTEDALQLELSGRVGELPLQARGRAGTYAALLSGENIELAAQLELANYQLELEGLLGSLARLEDFNVDAHFTGPDSKALFEALNYRQPAAGPVDLHATIADLPAGMRWLIEGQLGSVKMDVEGVVTAPLTLDGLQTRFTVTGDSLHRVASWLDIYTLPPEPFSLKGALSRDGEHLAVQGMELRVGEAILQADAALPHFPGTRDMKVAANMKGQSFARFRKFLGLQGVIDAPFDLDATIRDQPDGLEILESDLRIGSMHIRLDGPVGDYPDLTGSEVRFEFTGESLENLLAEAGIQGGPKLPFHATGRLLGSPANDLELADGLIELAGFSIQVAGELEKLANPDISDLRIRVDTASLGDSMALLGRPGLPDETASLNTSLNGPPTALVVNDIDLHLGGARLRLKGKLTGFPTLDGSQANIEVDIPGTSDWLPVSLREPVKISAQLRGAKQQLWLKQLKATGPDWQIRGGLHVSDLERQLGSLQLSMQGSELAALLPPIKGFQVAADPFMVEADVTREVQNLRVRNLQLQLGDNRLDVSGTLSDEAHAVLAVTAEGKSLASLGELDTLVLPAVPYSLAGQVSRSGTLWSAEGLNIQLGKQELLGSLQYLQQDRPRYVAKLRSEHFNLGQFVPQPGETKTDSAAAPAARGDLLIPDAPLPLAWMDQFDAELDLDLAGLNIPDPAFPEFLALDSLQLQGTLEGGVLNAHQFHLAGERGALSVPMTLKWRDDTLDMDLAVRSEHLKLSLYAKSYNTEGIPVQRVRSRFRARGGSAHQLASNLTGYLVVESGAGKLNNGDMQKMFDSFTTQVLENINPFLKKDPFTKLKCGVVGVGFYNGVAQLDPGAIIRTEKMDIMATGEIDLATEALQLTISTKARKGLGISAASLVTPFLEVGGTLAAPAVGIDKAGAAVTGGAAAATAGLSILASSLWNRYMNKTNPCELASENAQEKLDEVGAEIAGEKALGKG